MLTDQILQYHCPLLGFVGIIHFPVLEKQTYLLRQLVHFSLATITFDLVFVSFLVECQYLLNDFTCIEMFDSQSFNNKFRVFLNEF